MVESVNDQIHDELISHDVNLRRVDGGAVKRVEKRLDRLGSDLKGLAAKIDPFSTSRSDARERRLARLEKESTELIIEAYREINAVQRDDLQRVGAIETQAQVEAITKALP